jgi:hypothetical protein
MGHGQDLLLTFVHASGSGEAPVVVDARGGPASLEPAGVDEYQHEPGALLTLLPESLVVEHVLPELNCSDKQALR